MANNVQREQTARTPIGTIVNGTSNDSEITAAAKTSLESALTQGSYTARVVTGMGNYTIVKWYKSGKPFTTYKNKSSFTNLKALQFLNTMIDISTQVPAPTSVAVSPKTATKAPAATQQLTATVSPAEANQAVTWTTSDATKATVSSTGLVTAVATGSATITATTKSGPIVTDTSVITVS